MNTCQPYPSDVSDLALTLVDMFHDLPLPW